MLHMLFSYTWCRCGHVDWRHVDWLPGGTDSTCRAFLPERQKCPCTMFRPSERSRRQRRRHGTEELAAAHVDKLTDLPGVAITMALGFLTAFTFVILVVQLVSL